MLKSKNSREPIEDNLPDEQPKAPDHPNFVADSQEKQVKYLKRHLCPDLAFFFKLLIPYLETIQSWGGVRRWGKNRVGVKRDDIPINQSFPLPPSQILNSKNRRKKWYFPVLSWCVCSHEFRRPRSLSWVHLCLARTNIPRNVSAQIALDCDQAFTWNFVPAT